MSSDRGRSENPDPDVDTDPLDSTATDASTVEPEPGEPTPVDRSGLDEGIDSRDEEFSWTGPEVYFPLLIGGLALVAVPDPLTSLVGLVSILLGLSLAILDLRSSSSGVP